MLEKCIDFFIRCMFKCTSAYDVIIEAQNTEKKHYLVEFINPNNRWQILFRCTTKTIQTNLFLS